MQKLRQLHVIADLAIVFVLIVHVAGLLGIGGTGEAYAGTDPSPSRVCFSAQSWDADDLERPCVRIVRVFEDGSFRAVVTDAGGTFRYAAGVGAEDR